MRPRRGEFARGGGGDVRGRGAGSCGGADNLAAPAAAAARASVTVVYVPKVLRLVPNCTKRALAVLGGVHKVRGAGSNGVPGGRGPSPRYGRRAESSESISSSTMTDGASSSAAAKTFRISFSDSPYHFDATTARVKEMK